MNDSTIKTETIDFIDIWASRDEGNDEISILFDVHYDNEKLARKEVNSKELASWKKQLEKLQPTHPVEVRLGRGSLHFWYMGEEGSAHMFGIANVPPREYDECEEPILIAESTSRELVDLIKDGINSYAYECFR